MEQDNQNL